MPQIEMRERLLVALLIVKRDGPADNTQGICFAANYELGFDIVEEESDFEELLTDVMCSWPKAAGSRNFPVPGTNGKGYVASYIDFRRTKENMWDPETEYGRLRLELLDHCIAHLQGE